MDDFLADLRQALRRLVRQPGFSLVALATLGLGIGATTAVFTVVKSVLLEPLAYPASERLVVIQGRNPEAGFARSSISPLNFRDYRAMSTSFEAMAARTGTSLSLAQDEGPARRLEGQQVSADYLRVFGLPPALGRDFTAEDEQPGAPPVVILSHAMWQELGGDARLVESEVRLEGRPTTVIGVLPAGFPRAPDALVPFTHDYAASNRRARWLTLYARLRPGISVETARTELETVAAKLEASWPEANRGWSVGVDPLHDRVVEKVRPALWVLLAAVGLVLLIACANVAHLMLARRVAQEREVALRRALGAGRWRLARGPLAEAVLLALAAGGLGVLLAGWATQALVALDVGKLPRAEEIGVDGGVLLFALAAALGSVLVFGVLPMLAGGNRRQGQLGRYGHQGRGLRSGLVVAEVALALVLLVGAGLLIRSFGRLLGVDPGFEPERVWLAEVALPEAAYPEPGERRAVYQRLIEEAEALPGVERASLVLPMPLAGGYLGMPAHVEGDPIPEPGRERTMRTFSAGPGYFETMGIPVLRGRGFTLGDVAGAPWAAVVSATAAAQLWPGREALGGRVCFGRVDNPDVRWYTVVGVVGDVHDDSLDGGHEPVFYLPTLSSNPHTTMTVVARTAGEPTALAAPLRTLVARLDPGISVAGEQSGRQLIDGSVAAPRFNTALLSVFAGLALVLAALGVFGVMSYTVGAQRRELGVRVALGASRGQIVAQVLGGGLRPVAAGIALGLAAAAAATRLLASLVYGVSLTDPSTYALVGLLLAAAAVLACLGPALAATRVDPVEVLRAE